MLHQFIFLIFHLNQNLIISLKGSSINIKKL